MTDNSIPANLTPEVDSQQYLNIINELDEVIYGETEITSDQILKLFVPLLSIDRNQELHSVWFPKVFGVLIHALCRLDATMLTTLYGNEQGRKIIYLAVRLSSMSGLRHLINTVIKNVLGEAIWNEIDKAKDES